LGHKLALVNVLARNDRHALRIHVYWPFLLIEVHEDTMPDAIPEIYLHLVRSLQSDTH